MNAKVVFVKSSPLRTSPRKGTIGSGSLARRLLLVGILAPRVFVALDLQWLLAEEGEEVVLRSVEAAHVHGERPPPFLAVLAVDVPGVFVLSPYWVAPMVNMH